MTKLSPPIIQAMDPLGIEMRAALLEDARAEIERLTAERDHWEPEKQVFRDEIDRLTENNVRLRAALEQITRDCNQLNKGPWAVLIAHRALYPDIPETETAATVINEQLVPEVWLTCTQCGGRIVKMPPKDREEMQPYFCTKCRPPKSY